ncbi:15162_t:CDS:2, partial [Entrophospora sp. SA101]
GNEPLESVFELPKGWALKSNQKYGQKGGGNHMPVQITKLNIMVEEEGQFDKSEVPKLQTIKCKKNLER